MSVGRIPLLAEEGWTRHEENVPLPIWRGRGGQFGEIFRPEHFAKLLLRLRPIGLALRATPSAALSNSSISSNNSTCRHRRKKISSPSCACCSSLWRRRLNQNLH